MRQNIISPYFKNELKMAQEAIGKGEAIAYIGVYGIGKTLLAEQIDGIAQDYLYVYINLKGAAQPTLSELYSLILKRLQIPCKQREGKELTSFEFHYHLKNLLDTQPTLKICFIFEEAQKILGVGDVFFDNFEHLRYYYNPRISFIFFGQPQLVNFPTSGWRGLIKDNNTFLKTFRTKDCLWDIAIQEKRLNYDFNKWQRFIINASHGHHGTIKFICQSIATKKLTYSSKIALQDLLIHNPLMTSWFNEVASSLTDKQLLIIIEYLNANSLSKQSLQSQEYKELQQIRIFSHRGETHTFLFETFKKPLREYLSTLHIQRGEEEICLKEAEIYIKGIKCNSIFNAQELRILKYMILHKNMTIEYDKVADALWGAQAEESFSMYAISKLVSRIRKKFSQCGIAPQIVKTLPKRGYMLNLG